MFDSEAVRARAVARHLIEAYAQGGIFGNQTMPEDLIPPGVVPGSEEHLRFISLTVAIDYMRDADQLWNAARAAFADRATHYLFLPDAVAQTGLIQVIEDMQRLGLSRKRQKDAQIWQGICTTLVLHFQGQVGILLDQAEPRCVEAAGPYSEPSVPEWVPQFERGKDRTALDSHAA